MFEHLDDPNPVAAGPDQRTAVREEIGRHRRRRVQRAAAATAVAVLLVAVGGLWAFASHDESSVVDTTQTDPSWPSFCAAAARIRDGQQHVETTGGTVVVPGLDADYASLTESAPDPTLRQALLDAQPMLLGRSGPPTPRSSCTPPARCRRLWWRGATPRPRSSAAS